MQTKYISSIAIIMSAGSALGSVINANDMMNRVNQFQTPSGWIIQIDISGFSTIDAFGDPDNSFFSLIHLPKEPGEPSKPNANSLIGIGWDVSLTTVGSSWASEAAINFGGEIDLAVGASDTFSVTNQFYSSGGIIDLSDIGISSVLFGEDEYAMRVEFFESFDDTQNLTEAFFSEGSVLTLQTIHPAGIAIPSPGAGTALCLAGLAAFKRKR